MVHQHKHTITLAQSGAPREFRIFKAGENDTTKGRFVFDAAAAKSVMASYAQHGVDLPIDLEHLSVGELSRPDASDARGWFKLALRAGELWAVDVRWTPDGAARLANKMQRYISPCFLTSDNGRVARLVNCALVAQPATHGAQALVAASQFTRTASTTLSARFTTPQVEAVRQLAAARGTTVSELVRLAFETLAARALSPVHLAAAKAAKLTPAQFAAKLSACPVPRAGRPTKK